MHGFFAQALQVMKRGMPQDGLGMGPADGLESEPEATAADDPQSIKAHPGAPGFHNPSQAVGQLVQDYSVLDLSNSFKGGHPSCS